MKKIFTTILIALLFCTTIYADELIFEENYVVQKVNGIVKYETSEGTWESLKSGDKVSDKTVIETKLGSHAILTGEDGETYEINFMKKGPVGSVLASSKKAETNSRQTTSRSTIVEEYDMPERFDRIYSETFSKFEFGSIKNLPKNKNAIRLCSTSYSYDIIELTWTKSEASVTYYDGDQNKKSQRKIDRKEVDKIISLIEETDLYNLPSYTYTPNASSRDGMVYYVEANIDGSYKSVRRDWPFPEFVEDICHELYNLALNRKS